MLYYGFAHAQTPGPDAFNPGANSPVHAPVVQADGKILAGGIFTTLGGQSRSRIARLNSDGTLDNTFNPGADAWVYSLAMQADGKILVGGGFTALGGQTRNRIGRLNPDGILDATFNPGANMTTRMTTYWKLTRLGDREVVFEDFIKKQHAAKMGDAFVGAKRWRMTHEGVTRETIAEGALTNSAL
jgi:uncharacterized delta-60 repeat protein